ncbi:hypothetical protein ACPOL_7094 (plasmid) [Acidisarcina polymorpha]|uniref:Uncharacterized protein n=1 Tax=Acidisarcina polymorpha TaxID=2211140 RepID=A0A2Z5GCB4_9BACT|nr:hypothetical protein ACPOL_7094 [Acidisarcina polymorpha]
MKTPKQITPIPTHRSGETCSPSRKYPSNATTPYDNDEAGCTKL